MIQPSQLARLFVGLNEQKPNGQTILFCESASGFVPLRAILAQYKYCLNHRECEREYKIIRQYLERTFEKEEIAGLEVLVCRK